MKIPYKVPALRPPRGYSFLEINQTVHPRGIELCAITDEPNPYMVTVMLDEGTWADQRAYHWDLFKKRCAWLLTHREREIAV